MTVSRQAYARTVALIAVCVVALWIIVPVECDQDRQSDAPAELAPVGTLLNFTLKNTHGMDVKLESFKGKVILVNFWATWCGPCRAEIPDLIELQREYPDDVAVLGVVVMDRFGASVRDFASELRMNYPVLDATTRTDVEEIYGPMWALPTTILIDRGGNVASRRSGIGSKDQFERDLKPLL